MSNKNKLYKSVEEWNSNNSALQLCIDYIPCSPRNHIVLKIRNKDSVIRIEGLEGEELLFQDIINRIS